LKIALYFTCIIILRLIIYREAIFLKIGNRENVSPQKFFEGKVVKRILIGEKDGAPGFTMRLFTLQPGASTPYHNHSWEHEVFVLEGKLKIRSKNGEEVIESGSFVFVEPDEEHQFVNIDDGPSSFICVVPNYGEQ
jgi:quercetin dioxygenase-like cupin family protein